MKKIRLSGKYAVGKYEYALVDDDCYGLLNEFTWHAHRSGKSEHIYATTSMWLEDGRYAIRMHRLIMNPGKGQQIDHINHNTVDNRVSNLRTCSHSGNNANRKRNKNNTSGYKGVTKSKNGFWEAYIKRDSKRLGLGTYSTAQDAGVAYNKAALLSFGKFAYFNNIKGWGDKTPIRRTKSATPSKINKSGTVGVGRAFNYDRWLAKIIIDKKVIQLGSFKQKHEAIKARRDAELEHLGKTDIPQELTLA